MAFNDIVKRGPLSLVAAAALAQGNLVVVDASGHAAVAGASSIPLGFVSESVDSGAWASVEPLEGIVKLVAGIPIAKGDYVQVGTGGKLTVKTPAVAATTTLTSDATAPSDGDTVTLGSKTYTFKTALSAGPTVADEVLIGISAAVALDNLKSAVNGTAGVGTTYSTGTVASTQFTATTNTDTTQLFVAITPGTAGNAFASTEASSHLSFPAVTWATPGTGAAQDPAPTAFTIGQALTAATAADDSIFVVSLR
jgi:hypothetical protein